MAICLYCDVEMTTGGSCVFDALIVDGRRVVLARHGSERGGRDVRGRNCGDCGVVWGGFHHPGCDLQRCPVCRYQLLSCGCIDSDDETGDLE
ncbi:MAG: hypothetical protein WEB78_10385 [Ilumatobacteraceae bacterium]